MNYLIKKIKQELFNESRNRTYAFSVEYFETTVLPAIEKQITEYTEEMCSQQRELCAKQLEKFKFDSSSENAKKVFDALHQSMIEACKNSPSPMIKEAKGEKENE